MYCRAGEVDRPAGSAAGRHPSEAAHPRRRVHRTHRQEAARMRAYLAQIRMNLKLTVRDRMVLFFNYAFPLIFFFIFASLFRAEQGSGFSVEVVSMVLVIGVLGNGFFGAGIRATVDREMNILRRFKVAPISAAPILVSSLVTGLLNYLPS